MRGGAGGGLGGADPPTGVGMQLGPGRSPCCREATVTTLPKTDPVWLGGTASPGEELHHYDAQFAAQSTQPNYVRALHLRGPTLTLRGVMGVTDPPSQARATRYKYACSWMCTRLRATLLAPLCDESAARG